MEILIIIVSRIGDTLFATPSIKAISNFYKNSKITVLGHPKRYEVLKHLSFINHVGKISKIGVKWRGRINCKYDLAFVYGFDQDLVKYALRVSKKTVAFEQEDNKLNNKLFAAVAPPGFQSMHAVDQLLELPKALNIEPVSRRLFFSLNKKERVFAQQTLSKHKINNKILIGLQVASFPTKSYRDWPIENFLELCEKILIEFPDVHFVIFGGKAEKEKVDWLSKKLENNSTLLAGKLSLRETASIMSKIDLYIGVDTGPSHIMSTFDTPMIVLFHCLSSNVHTGAINHPHYVHINHKTSNCNEFSSMSDIKVSNVLPIVTSVLRTR